MLYRFWPNGGVFSEIGSQQEEQCCGEEGYVQRCLLKEPAEIKKSVQISLEAQVEVNTGNRDMKVISL